VSAGLIPTRVFIRKVTNYTTTCWLP